MPETEKPASESPQPEPEQPETAGKDSPATTHAITNSGTDRATDVKASLAGGRRTAQAVVDRVEEGLEDALYAVLLVGQDEEELIVPAHRLPRGATEGSWLQLVWENERLVELTLDEQTTQERRARIQNKRAALLGRGRRKFTPRS